MRIAVLALQGAFIEHEKRLSDLGISSLEIRQRSDVERSFDGLILPGGESTVQGKLLRELNLFTPLQTIIAEGLPVFGTCAGLILLAKEIVNDTHVYFATMDISVVRNAYGRQLGSFSTEDKFKGLEKIQMTFIRAPYIEKARGNSEILATIDQHIVAVRQENQLVTSFHPELNSNPAVHQYFLDMITGKV